MSKFGMKKAFCPKLAKVMPLNPSQKSLAFKEPLFWRCTGCGEKHNP